MPSLINIPRALSLSPTPKFFLSQKLAAFSYRLNSLFHFSFCRQYFQLTWQRQPCYLPDRTIHFLTASTSNCTKYKINIYYAPKLLWLWQHYHKARNTCPFIHRMETSQLPQKESHFSYHSTSIGWTTFPSKTNKETNLFIYNVRKVYIACVTFCILIFSQYIFRIFRKWNKKNQMNHSVYLIFSIKKNMV